MLMASLVACRYVCEFTNGQAGGRLQVLTPEGRCMQVVQAPRGEPLWGLLVDPDELRLFAVSKEANCGFVLQVPAVSACVESQAATRMSL